MDTSKIGDDYERLVETLLRLNIYRRDESGKIDIDQEGITVQRKRMFMGKSGQKHEIDISFELEVAGVSVLFLVECKCYGRAVGVDDLLEFSARLDDISANKGIFVTNTGFAAGARTIAKAKGIGLIVARRGKWRVVHRVIGEKPTWSYDYCYSNTALVSADGSNVTLTFCPINTRDLAYIEGEPKLPLSGLSGSWRVNLDPRDMYERTVFSIEETGKPPFTIEIDEVARERVKLLGPKEIQAIIERAMRKNDERT